MKQIFVRFKSYFFRGLAVLLPTIITIWIFLWGYKFIQGNISVHINRMLVRIILAVQALFFDSSGYTYQELEAFWINGYGQIAGFIIALILACLVGAMLANVVGKTIWRGVERSILRTPLLRQIYPYVKQISDFIFTQEEHKTRVFRKVVAVQYPRLGIWSMGFVTGSGVKEISDFTQKKFLTILIPTSPTPFTGFVIMVPEDETLALNLTIEEALRFSISGGVISPAYINKIALESSE